ncbi:MAG: cobyrinate a,c-diamide synthase [Oscillospiraceae bacterium]|jgi:cobyrinic acid a,c-diamide synthase|nr:cobyrinate a,c-diamide synthase [Oscillospiraceae bacterium]
MNMKTVNLPRVMIAGTHSGCGKTTVVCAVLRALIERGMRPRAFKSGPDYIDPMFHSRVTGAPARNLDAFLTGRESIPRLLARNGADGDIAVIEGVMGFYDGLSPRTDEGSAADIARLTDTPSILVVDPSGMSLSVAAMVRGYSGFRENTLKAVILNGVSAGSTAYYRDIIEGETGLSVLGGLPRVRGAELESRHLGLVTAGEIEDLRAKLQLLARAAEDNLDLDALLSLAGAAPPLAAPTIAPHLPAKARIAVASDAAFCFRYEDGMDELRRHGAELVEFSPIRDASLPAGCSGLYLCGGYPELYLEQLAANKPMLDAIRRAVTCGMPTVAECGGFMYLHERIDGYPMVGALRGEVRMTARLRRFGYFTMTAERDNLLCRKGETIRAHEFHYSESDDEGADFSLAKPNKPASATSVHANTTLYAGYPHLNFAGESAAAARFVLACSEYSQTGRV